MMKVISSWCLRFLAIAMWVLFAGMDPAKAQDHSARLQELVSRIQIMAEGTYTKAEWEQVTAGLDGLLAEARAANDREGIVETEVIRAQVLAARGDDAAALALMEQTVEEFRNQPVAAMKKVYVELSEWYARRGDEEAVNRLMKEFKASSHYDEKSYSFEGGGGPGDPLAVPRPSVSRSDSVSMTAMQVKKTQAHFAPGKQFPDFEAVDWSGRPLSSPGFRNKVLLVDFWTEGWLVWRRDLEYRKTLYEKYRARGLEVVGFYLGPDREAGRVYARENRIPWALADAPKDLLRTLGIYGDVSNFLVDGRGVILGRNLYAADLEDAIRRATSR